MTAEQAAQSGVCKIGASLTARLRFLDSGFRWAAPGILGGLFQTSLYRLRPAGVPSRRIQDFLSINDDERIDVSRQPLCVLSFYNFCILVCCIGGQEPNPTPGVIPAKAGIQWFIQSIPAMRE